MNHRLIWSSEARQDLVIVWDHVYSVSRDPDTADRYVVELANVIKDRTDYPETGFALFWNRLFTGYYSVNYKAYKAFYRLVEGRMEVLRILPVGADHLRILFPEQK